jgi:hypothetical protein
MTFVEHTIIGGRNFQDNTCFPSRHRVEKRGRSALLLGKSLKVLFKDFSPSN